MAKIKINQPIKNIKGEPFKDNGKELTYQDLFISILSAPKEKDDKKLDKYKLALKCVADEVEMTIDERKLLKDLANDSGINPILFGRVHDLLESS